MNTPARQSIKQPTDASRTRPLSLQRKCACGAPAPTGGQCSQCKGKLPAGLAVGPVDDPLEHEADRVADRVMASFASKPVSNAPLRVQRAAGYGTGSMQTARPSVECTLPGGVTAHKHSGTKQRFGRDFFNVSVHDDAHAQASARGTGPQADRFESRVPDGAAPAIVNDVLQSPGLPLDVGTRSFMESRFGHDFRNVRVHSDTRAAQSASAVNSLAYTVGSDVVFGAGQYEPYSPRGRYLLAHELTHVLQQKSAPQESLLQRFDASEVFKIAATFPDMLTQIKDLIAAASNDHYLDWDFLVEISGGTSVNRRINKELKKRKSILASNMPTIPSRLLTRYIFTCRCGLLDMRHFIELLYVSHFAADVSRSEARGNRVATGKGREHELEAPDSVSRFAAEDTPSNALGAATNLALPALPEPDAVFDAIKDTLTRCDPIGWAGLSVPSRDRIVHFYADRIPDPTPRKPGDLIPKYQNQTAVPDILPISECAGKERSLPYTLDTSDPDRKTLGGKAFDKGSTELTSDSDIRDFVATQRPEVLQSLPAAEKVRLVVRLMRGYVHDDDLDAIESIYRNSTTVEKQQIRAAVSPEDLSGGQRARLRLLFGT